MLQLSIKTSVTRLRIIIFFKFVKHPQNVSNVLCCLSSIYFFFLIRFLQKKNLIIKKVTLRIKNKQKRDSHDMESNRDL